MEYNMIDTHCHITCDALYERIEEVLKNAIEHYVTRLLIVCTNFVEYERAVLWKEKGYPLDIALGFHPNDLYAFKEEDYERLESLLSEDKLIALGEIGLDYHWDDVERDDQKVGFKRQIEIAQKYDKPILIHMRDATQDTIKILKSYAPCKGIMHCYSGSLETAKILMGLGLYISYAGPLTFKNSKGAVECAKEIPVDRLFVETDSPYLTPHPFRGKQNEPMYVTHTFEKLREIKGMDEEELSRQLEKNYSKLFAIKGASMIK